MRYSLLIVTAGALLMAGAAHADPQQYVNAMIYGDVQVNCTLNPDTGICLGGAIWAAGHVNGDANGLATVSLTDDLKPLVSGLLRQGASAGDQPFCGTITWTLNTGLAVIVFTDGVVFGTALSPCGIGDFSAVAGTVGHS
jgi:hypothetical protein